MKKMRRSLTALALTASMMVPLTACSSKDMKNTVNGPGSADSGDTSAASSVAGAKMRKAGKAQVVSESDPYFNITSSPLQVKIPDGKELSYRDFTNVRAIGDRVLANVFVQYKIPDQLQQELDRLDLDKDADWQRYMQITDEYCENSLQLFDLEGNYITTIETQDGAEFTGAYSRGNGEILLVTSKFDQNSCKATPKVSIIDATGKKVRDINIAVDDSLYDMKIYAIDNGNLLLASTGHFYLLDGEGNVIGKQEDPNLNGTMLCSGGKWYAVLPKYDQGNDDVFVREIDVEKGTFKVDQVKVDSTVLKLDQGQSDCFIVNNNGVDKYDLLSGTRTPVLSWNDTDVNSALLKLEGGHVENENEMIFFKHEYVKDSARTSMDKKGGNDSILSVVKLTRADKNPHAGKTILKVGVNGISNECFLEQIIKYNTDTSNTCRIELKDYSAEVYDANNYNPDTINAMLAESNSKLTMEMLSGNGPDILIGYSDVSQFNNENTLLNLSTYLAADSTIDKKNYYENIFSAFENEGKLFSVPITFTLDGMAINSDHNGAKEKWTFEEFDAFASALPDTVQVFSSQGYDKTLEAWMNALCSKFVDNVNRKVDFESDEFKKLLEMVKKYGQASVNSKLGDPMIDNAPRALNDDVYFMQSLVASCTTQLSGLEDLKRLQGYNRPEVIFTGFPSSDGMGMQAKGGITMSITTSAPEPDKAWEFIRAFLSEEVQQELSFNMNQLPVSRQALKTNNQTAIDVSGQSYEEYKKDLANGNAKLDENAAFSVITQEDAAKLEDIISKVNSSCQNDSDILNIVLEEAAGFFSGQRTVEDVCKNIQNRATTVVQER